MEWIFGEFIYEFHLNYENDDDYPRREASKMWASSIQKGTLGTQFF